MLAKSTKNMSRKYDNPKKKSKIMVKNYKILSIELLSSHILDDVDLIQLCILYILGSLRGAFFNFLFGRRNPC